MNRRNEQGVVLAMAVPHPDVTKNTAGQKVTVYWLGAADPHRWTPEQKYATRFVDERLALHTLDTLVPPGQHPGRRGARIWSEPALHTRNGGPTGPLVTEPPTGTTLPAAPAEPRDEQGGLFEVASR